MRVFECIFLAGILGALPAATAQPGSAVTQPGETRPLVVLDPGHGGNHTGATGVRGSVEKDIVLDIARRTQKLLQQTEKIRVKSTRIGDYDIDLVDRVVMANVAQADLLVSIHANATPRWRSKSCGIEVYILSLRSSSTYAAEVAARENQQRSRPEKHPQNEAHYGELGGILRDLQHNVAHHQSVTLAEILHDQLVLHTRAPGRGVFQAPLVVLTGARMPAALVEVGFVDHPREGIKLDSSAYRQRIASGIAKGICEFLRDQHKLPASPLTAELRMP